MTPRAHDIRQTARHLLVEEGVLPTNRLVRDRLGGGSPNLISETLRLFWQELGTELREASTYPGIPEAVLSAVQTLWKGALTAAETSYTELRVQLETQVAETHDALAQAQASITQMMEQSRSDEAERDRLQETLSRALQRASHAEAAVVELNTQLVETRALAVHQTELAQIHAAHAGELKQALDEQAAAAQVREAALQTELERVASEHQLLEQRRDADLTALETAHQQTLEAQAKARGALESLLSDRQHQLDRQQDTLAKIQAELEGEHRQVLHLTQAHTEAQQRIDSLGRELSASQAQLAVTEKTLAGQTAAAEARFTALLTRVDALSATSPERKTDL